MRHYFLKIVVLLVAVIAFSCSSEKDDILKQPNIIFIMTDDHGYGELGCYGNLDIETPNIDKLAENGVRFTNFYANAPICSPTRAAFLTGRYQQRIGLDDALHYQEMGRGLPIEGRTIGNDLQSKGYDCGLFGKWHVGYDYDRRPLQQGFNDFFGILGGNHHYFDHMDRIGVHDLWLGNDSINRKGYTTDLITDEALRFIEKNRSSPFFLFLSHLAPHFPYLGPNDQDKVVKPKHKSWQKEGNPETYIEMVESVDATVGRILQKISELNLSNRTLIVFTSDNGGAHYAPYVSNGALRGYKGDLFEGGIRVPCIAQWKGVLPKGETSDQVAITMDWTSTFLRLAGVDSNKYEEDGIDLMPILKRHEKEVERTLFWRRIDGPIRNIPTEYRAVRSGDWKLIEEIDSPKQYLYNLKLDQSESNNLINNEPEIVKELNSKLNDWEKSVNNDAEFYNN
ncbi:sulfatase-like hydrolase/transferase [Membranihabitans maritimus]|uniref:sulfatase-like hydrolase/transferase n=1 Tax=Membranihabitans maritimus TaxID=2904244 RepID=UPI001F006703|nr:sulfatase-like hydrolase/transferase [Membranihabitans maritimus]